LGIFSLGKPAAKKDVIEVAFKVNEIATKQGVMEKHLKSVDEKLGTILDLLQAKGR